MFYKRTYFFQGLNPADVSDIVVSLAAGNKFELDRLPDCILPHVTLLASVGIAVFNQLIIDDYYALLRRVEEVFATKDYYGNSAFNHKIMNHPQLMFVGLISRSRGGLASSVCAHPEMGYVVKLYQEFIGKDVEDLFSNGHKVDVVGA